MPDRATPLSAPSSSLLEGLAVAEAQVAIHARQIERHEAFRDEWAAKAKRLLELIEEAKKP